MPSERTPRVDASWMSRPLQWLTAAAIRFPLITLLLAGATVGGSIWLTMTRLGFRTSRAELLNPQSDYNRRWLEYTKEFGDKEDVVVVIEGESRERIAPALDDVCRRLAERTELFADVMHEMDAPRLRAKGLYYLTPDDLRQINGFLDQAAPVLAGDWSRMNLGGMAQWMGTAMSGGSRAEREQIVAAMQTELPRAIAGLTSALGAANGYKSPWPEMAFSRPEAAEAEAGGRLISNDGRMGFILLRLLEKDIQSFAQNSQSIGLLRTIAAETQMRHPGTKIGLTGLPIIEYDEMRSSEDSMASATILSFLGVWGVMIVAFGGFRHVTMAMAAMMAGMFWACGCIALIVGHVNLLSIAFGSILFGLGIDYGIHYIARYLKLRETTESTREALITTAGIVGPGILASAATAAIAFFAAGFTEFPGVSQLGMLAGGGIVLCWLAEAVVLPAMIRFGDRDGASRGLPATLNLRFWLRPLFAFPRLTLAAAACATCVAAIGVRYLHYDYNLLNLQPVGLESVELEHKLFNQTNRSAWFAISMAATPEEALDKKAKFETLPMVERVVEVASRLPSDVALKRPLIEQIHGRLANLPSTVPQIPVTPAAELDPVLSMAEATLASSDGQAAEGLKQLRGMLRQIPSEEYARRVGAYQQAMAEDFLVRLRTLKAAASPEPPCVADLPESVAARFVAKSGRYLLQVYSKATIWDVGPMGQFVAQVRSVDPEATGNPLQVYEASRQMKRSFEWAAVYALLAIVPIILFDFRRLNHTLLAMLPMGVGLLQTLGLMGLLDIPLNPANMIVLPLTLGLGVDCGINLVHEARCVRGRYRGADNAALVAIVLCALTTMVGFGALMMANHRGLQSLGRVLTISMGCCMVNSLLLPNLLVAGGFAGCRDAIDDEEDDDDDEDASGGGDSEESWAA